MILLLSRAEVTAEEEETAHVMDGKPLEPTAGWGLFRVAIGRGWKKRCPHCGVGALYSGWIQPRTKCSCCGLVNERNQGDTWFFVHFIDRLLLGVLILIVFLGILRTHPWLAALLFLAIGALLVWTTPNRWGVCTALHYLTRAHSKDVDDPIPGPLSSR